MLRRSEGTRFSSESDDEIGALEGAIRACDVRAARRPTSQRAERAIGHSELGG
jgi:hypothetical protein